MNMKLLLLSLVVFSFLLAGCGGKKDTGAAPLMEIAPGEAAQTPPSSAPVADEEVVIAPSTPSEPPIIEEVPGEEVPEIPAPPAPPEPQEANSADADELANLFDIELNEPPEDFEYGDAPGE